MIPLRTSIVRRSGAALAGAALAGTALAAAPAGAQERLIGARTIGTGPFFEVISFGDDFLQPTVAGAEVGISRVTQLSVPVSVLVPIGRRFSVDVSGGYASGEVERTSGSGTGSWSLAGMADTKVRLTGRLAGETVVFTLGANLPTGSTELDTEEYEAARVLSAPALGLRVPVLGAGTAYTAGVVAAHDVGAVSLAFGFSYEMRSGYSPTGVVAGIPSALEYNPSDATRVAFMADALVGQGQMTLGLSVDAFSEGTIVTGAGAGSAQTMRLGPVLTGEWHWRLTPPRLRSLDLSVVNRYRSNYTREGERVQGSAANYLDVGMRGQLPVGRRTNLVLGLDGRHQTGMDSDATLAAAAFAGGGLTLGLARELGGGFQLEAVTRGMFGRMESADRSTNVTGFGGGIVLARRF